MGVGQRLLGAVAERPAAWAGPGDPGAMALYGTVFWFWTRFGLTVRYRRINYRLIAGRLDLGQQGTVRRAIVHDLPGIIYFQTTLLITFKTFHIKRPLSYIFSDTRRQFKFEYCQARYAGTWSANYHDGYGTEVYVDGGESEPEPEPGIGT